MKRIYTPLFQLSLFCLLAKSLTFAQQTVTFSTVGSTSWTVPSGVSSVSVLVVGGGGGGGWHDGDGGGGGGGGGGVIYNPSYSVTPGQAITVVVGAGGTAGFGESGFPTAGGSSQFGTQTAAGGAGGGNWGHDYGWNGASGGGGTDYDNSPGGSGISGQGHEGGAGSRDTYKAGGGGGGASSPGSNGDGASGSGGAGGAGYSYSGVVYGSGGGGGTDSTAASPAAGGNGAGNGGTPTQAATAGTNGRGGGGGGSGNNNGLGGNGGSGAVIIAYSTGSTAPVITSGTSATGVVGTSFSYQISATNSPTGFGATGLPAGLAVNTSTGLISGTATNAGTSTITVSATNGAGTGSANLSLTINSSGGADVTSGLVGWWKFDEGSGTTVADGSGGGNTGTLQNGGWVTGKVGSGALSLAGAGGMTTATQFNNPQVYTISAWFKTTASGAAKIIGFERDQAGINSSSWCRILYLGTDHKLYFGWNSGVLNVVTSSVAMNDGAWHHAVGTHTGTVGALYIDGVLQGTGTGGSENFPGYWRVGFYRLNYWPAGADGYFAGNIDDVRVYNRALTQGEVATLYALGGSSGGPPPNSNPASGGTISVAGDTFTHVFNSSGNFTVPAAGLVSCQVLIVGGGGGGGGGDWSGGGGGAGGVLYYPTLSLSAGTYQIVVGNGGAAGADGQQTTALSHVAAGGGAGGQYGVNAGLGRNGGSGGGGAQAGSGSGPFAGGTGMAGQGYAGGSGYDVGGGTLGGGGGGAGGPGQDYDSTNNQGGNGGPGVTYILGSWSGTVGGGGGGGGFGSGSGGGLGGNGGGGTHGQAGAANTGGGGGGSQVWSGAGSGGSGLVVITYRSSVPAPNITSPGVATGYSGVPFSYTITGTQWPTSFGTTGALPAGLVLNAATGAITGTPTQTGTFNITMSATNSGGTGTAPLAITLDSPPLIVILNGNNQTGVSGQFNTQPFDIAVWNAAGTQPLVNKPITFTVQSGGGLLATTSLGNPALSASLSLTTDADGTAMAYYKQPAATGITSQIRVASEGSQTLLTSQSAAAAPLPTTPPSIMLVTTAPSLASFSWGASSATSGGTFSGYNIYRILPGGTTTKLNTSGVYGVTSFIDTTAPSGISLTYAVRAVDAGGLESAAANLGAVIPASSSSGTFEVFTPAASL